MALLFAGGCGREAEIEVQPRPVQVFEIAEPGESPFRRFPAEVAPGDVVRLSFDVPGRIIELPATQGMMASKGDVLARLDPETFQARVDSAQADFNNAQAELARRRQLFERGVISESEFDSHVRAFQNAESALRVTQRAIEDTVLVAPRDGRVAQTLADNRQTVAAGSPVLVFQDVSMLEVHIQLPESDMAVGYRGVTAENAREMLEARVEFPSVAGRQFDLKLYSFSTQASVAARTFQVTFLLDPPEDANILPGMTGTVSLRRLPDPLMESAAEGKYLVPLSAVDTRGTTPQVWRLDPDSMTPSPLDVEVLAVLGDSLQVQAEELRPGDELVRAGVRFLAEGMQVTRMDSTGHRRD